MDAETGIMITLYLASSTAIIVWEGFLLRTDTPLDRNGIHSISISMLHAALCSSLNSVVLSDNSDRILL
jgi:hypothetical protein